MTQQQAIQIKQRLQNMFPNQTHYSNEEFTKIFLRYIMPLNFEKAVKAVELIMRNNKYIPSIAEFNQAYMTIATNMASKADDMSKYAECEICGKSGFLIYSKEFEGVIYDFIAYCKCERGKRWQISGNDFWTLPVSDVYDVEWLKETKNEGNELNVFNLQTIKNVLAAKFKEGW